MISQTHISKINYRMKSREESRKIPSKISRRNSSENFVFINSSENSHRNYFGAIIRKTSPLKISSAIYVENQYKICSKIPSILFRTFFKEMLVIRSRFSRLLSIYMNFEISRKNLYNLYYSFENNYHDNFENF